MTRNSGAAPLFAASAFVWKLTLDSRGSNVRNEPGPDSHGPDLVCPLLEERADLERWQRQRPRLTPLGPSPGAALCLPVGVDRRDTAMTGSSGSDQNVGLDLADARLHFSLDEKYSS